MNKDFFYRVVLTILTLGYFYSVFTFDWFRWLLIAVVSYVVLKTWWKLYR